MSRPYWEEVRGIPVLDPTEFLRRMREQRESLERSVNEFCWEVENRRPGVFQVEITFEIGDNG